ncbi:MAG: CamS family sex pheromone protein [Bacilli bacterium]
MKKVLFIILILFVITGCGNKEEKKPKIIDNSYYQIFEPYKEGSNYTLKDYDINNVEKMLMQLSTKYFKTNNSFFQEGQFLTNEELKDLLIKYNPTEDVIIDNIPLKPVYISSIVEQDYLATNGNIKGISLGIILNKEQIYTKDNKTSIKILSDEEVLNYGKLKAQELLDYMRSKEDLKNVKIAIGLYLESNVKGAFKYMGLSENKKINLDFVDYSYKLLDSNEVMNIDLKNYNNISQIENKLNTFHLYTNAIGLYQKNNLISVEISIEQNYLKQAEILNIISIINQYLDTFDSYINIKVYLKSENKIKAFISKKANEIETYILEG